MRFSVRFSVSFNEVAEAAKIPIGRADLVMANYRVVICLPRLLAR
jgi:hypothetical protein